ncbi:MAG: hypothetical protein ACTS3R_07820 [Inquilinaceae bacterium]
MRITTYGSRLGVPVGPSAPRRAGGSPVGAALVELGDVSAAIGDDLMRREEADTAAQPAGDADVEESGEAAAGSTPDADPAAAGFAAIQAESFAGKAQAAILGEVAAWPDQGSASRAAIVGLFDQSVARHRDHAPSPAAAEALERWAGQYRPGLATGAAAVEAQVAGERVADDLAQALETYAGLVASQPEQYAVARWDLSSRLERAKAVLPAEAVEAFQEQADRRLADAAARSLIDRSPADALAWLDGEGAASLPADRRTALKRAARREGDRHDQDRSRMAEADRVRRVSDLAQAIAGGDADELDIDLAAVDGARWLTPTDRQALMSLAGQVREDEKARTDRILRVAAAGVDAPFLDPGAAEDARAIDDHFAIASAAWADLPPADQAARVVGYATAYGVVPTAVRRRVGAALTTGRPADAALAASFVRQLADDAPWIDTGLGAVDRLQAHMVAADGAAGVPDDAAVDRARDAVQPADTVRRTREGRYRLDDHADGNAAVLRLIAPDAPDAMRAAFEDRTALLFGEGGDIDAARRVAWQDLSRRWAQTAIGPARWQQDAPEAVYANGVDPSWMAEQLRADLRRLGHLDRDGTLDTLRLLPPAGGRDGYEVRRIGEGGVETALPDADGAPLRWRPHWPTSPEARRRQRGSRR